MRLPLYSQNLHTLVIDSFPITGFADGDWLSIKVDGGGVVRSQGATGPVLNRVAPQGGQIIVNLLPTSPALGDLLGLWKDAQAAPRLFNLSLITGVEEILVAKGCGFGDMPEFRTGGLVMSPRGFVIEFTEIVLDSSGVKKSPLSIFGGLINF